jgi:DNA-binding PadR family transcriptional regulator
MGEVFRADDLKLGQPVALKFLPEAVDQDPEALLPLTPGMFQVLIALADGEKHGYAIIKEVARRTGGAVRLSAGTLYTIIRRFVQEGVIAESDQRPDPALDDERRRYYRVTDFGRDVARAEARRMETVLGMARAKNLIPKARPA